MTAAVCIKCGAMKRGAWTPCPACRYAPDTDEEYTRSLLLSDHFAQPADLAAAAERIQQGEPVTFDEQTLKDHWVSKADVQRAAAGARSYMIGCMALLLALLAALYFTL